jgi:phosphoglucosamine mutase
MRRYFGTDGIRGKVGAGCLTPHFLQRLGFAANNVLNLAGKRVLIAHDGRESADLIISALSSGLLSGCHVDYAGLLPTPVLAALAQDYAAGFMISASHNPYYDNGIKIFSSDGFKLDDEVELKLEDACDNLAINFAAIGRLQQVDKTEQYLQQIAQQFSSSLKFKVVLDCANGAWSSLAQQCFEQQGCSVITINNKPDGRNINADCGALHPIHIQQAVLDNAADVGFAFDGDGDRLIACSSSGAIVDGDAVLYVLATLADEQPQGVVGTLMTNLSLQQSLQARGIDFVRAKVGDRYVLGELRKRGWTLGGEGSGHILNLDYAKTGDAVLSALQLLTLLDKHNCSLDQALEGYTACPQVLLNVRAPAVLLEESAVSAAIRASELALGDTGRVLVRASGTEPLLRVMVEAHDLQLAKSQAQNIVNSIENVR